MIEQVIDSSLVDLVDWSRAQFALTAMYHWIFVPLTLGISFIIAIMETIYYKTKNPEWKSITKFWRTGLPILGSWGTFLVLRWQLRELWHSLWNRPLLL